MTDIAYSIRHLIKKYYKTLIPANDDLSIDIETGKIFGIFGPNGAGKTTLIRQMAGLIKPTSGSILLYGIDITKHPQIVPHYISYYAQTPWILWSHRVWEALYFTGLFRGLSKKEAKIQTEKLLVMLDLYDIRNQLMERISGGQSKMLGIGTSLIGDRTILILDEPTNELDPLNRSKLWNLFIELCREKNKTIILVTHNIYEAEQVVDQVIIIDKGKIIAQGTPGELKQRIENRVRIEIKFKNHIPLETQNVIYHFKDAKQLKSGKWQIFVPKNDISLALNEIIQTIGVMNLDDFRVITATLEDVYIQMGGSLDELPA